jgi:hypothetical protein
VISPTSKIAIEIGNSGNSSRVAEGGNPSISMPRRKAFATSKRNMHRTTHDNSRSPGSLLFIR